MNPIECSACSELFLGFCWQRSFAFMSMSTCVCEGVCERNDINSTIVCDKPFATHTSVHTHTLECPPLTPSYTLPTVPYIPRELHTHSFRHANPQSPLVTFCFYFSPVFSPQPSQLSKLILLLLQSDLSQFVWTQEFFFLCGCAV